MRRLTILCAALLLAGVLPARSMAQDDPRAVPVFNAQHALRDVLNAAKAKGKVIEVVIRGGASYAGKVKDVGTEAVILTELRGKEFFDAWIPLGAIVAMEERVRLR